MQEGDEGIRGHDEIVLNDETSLFRMKDEALDDLGGDDTLFRVEVGRGLVNQINIRGLPHAQYKGHTLQLSSRQVLHHVVDDWLNCKGFGDVSHKLGVEVGVFDLLL